MSHSVSDLGPEFSRTVLHGLKQVFVGKDEIIDLLGICIVGGENLFMLGPPGTAKSAIVHELGSHIEGKTFTYLLTRFTEPNELFGPFDIRKLRDGELVTNTDGMLPEASIVFLDELFNANSAILNCLLTVLNERIFRRGRETYRIPALTFVSASNRLPDDEVLGALFDRFLVRVACDNVDSERLSEVLAAGWRLETGQAKKTPVMHMSDVEALHNHLPSVDLDGVQAEFTSVIHAMRRAGIAISDRRAVKFQRLVAASALICGRTTAVLSDFWVLRYTWDTEEQQEILREIVQTFVARDTDDTHGSHPRSQDNDAPDPEVLARDLDTIETEINGAETDAIAAIRDRLGLLAGRCQWIKDDEQRAFLTQRLDVLLSRTGEGQ